MTLLLTGISNENEFYTNYYMSEVLEADLKEIGAKWRSDAEKSNNKRKTPPDELRGLADDYFRFKKNLSKESNPIQRLGLQREFTRQLLSVLGYEQKCTNRALDDHSEIPILCEVTRHSGEPELWILEGYSLIETATGEADPLELVFSNNQFEVSNDSSKLLRDQPIQDIISKQVFSQSEPPRWVIVVSDSQLLLIDRSKWNDQRLLRFDLEEMFARREPNTLAAASIFLCRDNLVSAQGQPLLDALDEKSHKHAQTVTQDLKYALQQCIEIIGNEAIHYLRNTLKEKIYEREIAKQLTLECLRFMYRLLFILYKNRVMS